MIRITLPPLRPLALLLPIATALAGCAFDPPKPWEKQNLAQPSMQFDADAQQARQNLHVYQSKEGASGGYGAGGGGCGCN